MWREAVTKAFNAAQLAMAFYILESSIAWDKSIMKVSNSELPQGVLNVCQGVPKGFHTGPNASEVTWGSFLRPLIILGGP